MDNEEGLGSRRRRRPRYENEDTSATTTEELKGFYAYGVAAEVFAVCGVGSFLPVTLEALARERGVLFSDRTTSCVAKAAQNSGSNLARRLLSRGSDTNNQCVIKVLGVEITTSSFAMYTFSIAVFVQALALVSFSSVADHGHYRKRFLVAFGYTGAATSMAFIAVVPHLYLVGSLLVIIGVTCLGSSFVLLNSFLPVLISNHPDNIPASHQRSSRSPSIHLSPLSPGLRYRESAEYPLQHDVNVDPKSVSPDSSDLKLSTRISSKGVGLGYIAAVFVQVLSILLLFVMSKMSLSTTLPLRMVLFLVGSWWAAFTIPASIYLKARPGPPLHNVSKAGHLQSCLAHITFAWLSLFRTVKVAFQLRQVVIFLVAWFLLSDATATISGTAILFARTELQMGTVAIALLSITATSAGIAGAFAWPIISRRFALQTNRVIVACVLLMEIIPLYGLLGYISFVKSWGVGGLQQIWEIYALGFLLGFVMGGLSSYCRSYFGLLIPPGSEAAFYALYAITDKGSSAVGPAIVGVIVDATGQIRPAFGFLALLVALPIPILIFVDAEKGQADAARMAGALHQTEDSEQIQNDTDTTQEATRLMRDHD